MNKLHPNLLKHGSHVLEVLINKSQDFIYMNKFDCTWTSKTFTKFVDACGVANNFV